MLKISSTSLLEYPFSVIYDTHLIYSGFFTADALPQTIRHLHPVKESSTLADEICQGYSEDHSSHRLPMRLTGTEFQKKVWATLENIPKGSVLNYTQVAALIDHPLAVRAVGSACGKNPLTLIIPCHRVVGIGSLGGYLWGLDIKKSLLAHEACQVKSVVY
jgi:O-6-methylguanine DNA methyltransferase